MVLKGLLEQSVQTALSHGFKRRRRQVKVWLGRGVAWTALAAYCLLSGRWLGGPIDSGTRMPPAGPMPG